MCIESSDEEVGLSGMADHYLVEIEAVEVAAVAIERAVQARSLCGEQGESPTIRDFAYRAIEQYEGISEDVRAYADMILEDTRVVENLVLEWLYGTLEITVIFRESSANEKVSEPELSGIELLLSYGGPTSLLTFDPSKNGRCDLAVYSGSNVAIRPAFCPHVLDVVKNFEENDLFVTHFLHQ